MFVKTLRKTKQEKQHDNVSFTFSIFVDAQSRPISFFPILNCKDNCESTMCIKLPSSYLRHPRECWCAYKESLTSLQDLNLVVKLVVFTVAVLHKTASLEQAVCFDQTKSVSSWKLTTQSNLTLKWLLFGLI